MSERDHELLSRGAITLGIAEPFGNIGAWLPRKRNPIATGDSIAEVLENLREAYRYSDSEKRRAGLLPPESKP